MTALDDLHALWAELKLTTRGYTQMAQPLVPGHWKNATAIYNRLEAELSPPPPPPPPSPGPTGSYLYNVDATHGHLTDQGRGVEDHTNASTAGIVYGSLALVTDPADAARKALQLSVPGASSGNRQAVELLQPMQPVLGRRRFVGQGIYLPANWASIYGSENERGGDWGCLVTQLHYAGLHGCPIGLAVHKDRVAVAIMTGASVYDQNSAFQTNLVSGGDGSPAAYPSCLGRQVARPGELAAAPMGLGVWHFFAVELVEAIDNSGMVAIWHKVTGGSWTKTWQLDGIPTHQCKPDGSWSWERNDKFCLYTPNGTAQSLLQRDSISSASSLADAAAALGV